MTGDRRLGIYLNDHLAVATALRDRCRVSREANGGTEVGRFLDELFGELIEDRRTLLDVMAAVGAAPSPFKTRLAQLGEHAGRLKLNGQLTGYSPLSRLVELEAFSVGAEGKRLLWVSLATLADRRLERFDFDTLAVRAQRQRDGLEGHRRAAAPPALGA